METETKLTRSEKTVVNTLKFLNDLYEKTSAGYINCEDMFGGQVAKKYVISTDKCQKNKLLSGDILIRNDDGLYKWNGNKPSIELAKKYIKHLKFGNTPNKELNVFNSNKHLLNKLSIQEKFELAKFIVNENEKGFVKKDSLEKTEKMLKVGALNTAEKGIIEFNNLFTRYSSDLKKNLNYLTDFSIFHRMTLFEIGLISLYTLEDDEFVESSSPRSIELYAKCNYTFDVIGNKFIFCDESFTMNELSKIIIIYSSTRKKHKDIFITATNKYFKKLNGNENGSEKINDDVDKLANTHLELPADKDVDETNQMSDNEILKRLDAILEYQKLIYELGLKKDGMQMDIYKKYKGK